MQHPQLDAAIGHARKTVEILEAMDEASPGDITPTTLQLARTTLEEIIEERRFLLSKSNGKH